MTKDPINKVSLYSARNIQAGTRLEHRDIALFENDKGIPVDEVHKIYGRVLTEDLCIFKPITFDILH